MTQKENEYLDNSEEVETPETEKMDFNKPDFQYIPKGNCQYRQSGPYLICYSCDLKHAVWIGMDRIMVGENEQGPILKRRDLK